MTSRECAIDKTKHNVFTPPYLRILGVMPSSPQAFSPEIALLACRDSSLVKGSSGVSRAPNTVRIWMSSLIFWGIPNRFLMLVYRRFTRSAGLMVFNLLDWAKFQPEILRAYGAPEQLVVEIAATYSQTWCCKVTLYDNLRRLLRQDKTETNETRLARCAAPRIHRKWAHPLGTFSW